MSGEPRRSFSRPSARGRRDASALALVAAGAAVGFLAGLHPLEIPGLDPVVTAVVFAAAVWCAGRLPRGPLTLVAVVAAVAVPLSWAAVCLAGVVALDLGRRPPIERDAGRAAGLLLVLATTGLVDRGTAHVSAAVATVALAIVLIVGLTTLPRGPRRMVTTTAVLLLVVGGVTSALFALRALDARTQLSRAIDAVNAGLDAARDGDDDLARSQLDAARRDVAAARSRLDTWWLTPTRLVPVVAPNARITVDTLTTVDDALTDLSESVDGLRFDALSFDDGRVDLDEIDRLYVRLSAANDTVSDLSVLAGERSVWLVDAVTDRLDQLEGRITEIGPSLDDATTALDVLPAILGGEGERRYLLVFVQPAEARGGGGFPGNWAEVVTNDGRVELARQGRIGDLAAPAGTQWTVEGQDEYLGRYDTFRVRSQWQNVTMSPDFPTVADVMTQIYPQATGRSIDGVIRVGPPAIAALLRITGPVPVEGRDEPLTADDAVEFITRTQYAGEFADNQDRVDYLGDTVDAVFDVLSSAGVGNPVTAARHLQPAIDSGDLVMWLPTPAEADLVDRLGMSGALPPATGAGDTFTVTQHDLLPNKIDAWSQRKLTYDVQVNGDTGVVQGVVGVELVNDAPLDGSDYQVGGQSDLPRGTMRELITIFSPFALDSLTVNGEPAEVLLQSELGYLTHQVEVIVPAGESVVIEAFVYGEGVVDADGVYRLTVPVNPAVLTDRISVTINNDRTVDRRLDRPLVIECRPSLDRCD